MTLVAGPRTPLDDEIGHDPLATVAVLEAEMQRRWGAGVGRLDEMCGYALIPSGKLFRPVLLVESAVAVGGQVEAVLAAAVGTECGHVASLIHDDIIDRDDVRRGRPSVPAAFGADDAIVTGDRLLFELFQSLAECRAAGVPAEWVVAALAAVSAAGIDLCRGQTMEAEVTGDLTCTVEQYLEVIRLKTAALFRGACQSGALLGGGDAEQVRALVDYGDHLGVAFQIHDDLLPYTSTSEAAGKSVLSDVRNRRLTLPVILAYAQGDQVARHDLERVLDGTLDVAAAFTLLRSVLDRTGAIAAAVSLAEEHAAQACTSLDLLPPSSSRETLRYFARASVRRDR